MHSNFFSGLGKRNEFISACGSANASTTERIFTLPLSLTILLQLVCHLCVYVCLRLRVCVRMFAFVPEWVYYVHL